MTHPAFLPGSYDAAFLANAASATIRRYCRWHVAPVITETLVLDGPGGRTLHVPSLRIRSVTRVLNDGADVTDRVRWSPRSGLVSLDMGWSCELGAVEVELTHGYGLEEVPEIAALVVAIGKRVSSGNGAVVQQSAGGMSIRAMTTREGMAAGVPLFESEKATLAPYVIPARA